MKYKLVFVDIDGVLRDFVAKMKEVFQEDFPNERIIREDLYDLREWSTIGDKIFPWVTDTESAGRIFADAPEHPRSMQAFQQWLDKVDGGFPRFVIVTHQKGKRVGWTRKWLTDRGIRGRLPVYYTLDKPAVMESVIGEVSEEIGTSISPQECVLLDDNISELEGAYRIGVNTVCISRSWNQQWKGERIEHLGEFDPFIET